MASDGRSKSYQSMLIVTSQRWAAECHQHAATWMQPCYGRDTYAQSAAVREQLIGAVQASEARERLFAIIDGKWLPSR